MNNQKKSLLQDVVLLRVIVIFLLVIYHAFIIYSHGWKEPVVFQENSVYWWMAKFSYSFMLETFVFISGYLLAYQAINGKLQEVFWHFTKKKASRLVLPCLIFSIIYFLMFRDYSLSVVYKDIYNGSVGHLWFLPMLFWCYLMGYI
jgi:fucose 4-O-acetylase-like acetyltransferase